MNMSKCITPLAIAILLANSAVAQEDPGATGPRAVTAVEYTGPDVPLGDISEVEVRAKVHRPTSMSDGPYPLVLFLHGNHYTCYVAPNGPGRTNVWPCDDEPGLVPLPNYRGYDYVASILASHGMIVASIDANAINAHDEIEGDFAIGERAQLVRHHLDKWATFNSTGGSPFGTTFVGKVDLQRIAFVGHSRGGQAMLNAATDDPPPAGLRAVMGIAPTGSGLFTPLRNVPLALLLGYCDADQFQMRNLGFIDEARYGSATDNTPKYTILGFGANHNYFNSMWGPSAPGGSDDWGAPTDAHCGTQSSIRLNEEEQRGFGRAYIAAFLRKHLLGQRQFDSILNGDALAPPSAPGAEVFLGYLPGDNDRKDLNRLDQNSAKNALDGDVTSTGVTVMPCGGSLPRCMVASERLTHWPTSGHAKATRIEWAAAGGSYSNALPPFKRDLSNFSTLQFRVTVDHTDTDNTVGQSQDFSVRLTGADGRSSLVRASDYSGVLYYPPGSTADRRASVLNTFRVPLEAFDVDLTNVASVDIVFDRTAKGRVILADLAFAEKGTTAAEKWLASTYTSHF